MMNKCIQWSER